MEKLNLFMRLSKVDSVNRTVSGIATAEVLDKSGEIMDYDSTVPYYKAWSDEIAKATDGKSLGNVRAMHGKVAAGKVISIDYDDVNKAIRITAKIVDDQEWKKCEEGVYTGFSQGGAYIKRWSDPSNPAIKRYTAEPAEVSIVDNPCVGIATFEYVKADGATELRKFEVSAEAETDIEQVWRSKKDGAFFAKKAEAVNHNLDLAVTKVTDTVADALATLKKAQDAVAEAGKEPAVEPVIEPAVEKTVEAEPTKAADGTIVTEADVKVAVIKTVLASLNKQLCDIPMIVDVIYSLDWLQSNLAMDALFHDAETASLPADLKTILASLCAFLKALVEEGVADIAADAEAAKTAGLTESHVAALRKFTGNDELLKDLSFTPPEPDALAKAESDHAAALEKVNAELVATQAARVELEQTISTLTVGLQEVTKGIEAIRTDKSATESALEKRIQELEAQPMPAKGFVGPGVTVEKGHEGKEAGSTHAPVEASTKNFRGLSPAMAVEKLNAKKSTQQA